MRIYKEHLILRGSSIKEALEILNKLAPDPILFVVDQDEKLVGALTDGDIRRGLLNNFTLSSLVDEVIQTNPRFIRKGENDIQKIISYRENYLRILPVVDDNMRVVNVINFRTIKSYLPLDAVIMAGGRGQRLFPLTQHTPKPLLTVGDKPIIEYNIDRLASFGVDDFWISVNYLGHQIESYFGNGSEKNINIEYVKEEKPLGTLGAVSNIGNFKHDYVLIANSDILTNLDYEHFFLEFLQQNADLAVTTIPYHVNIPYAVIETVGSQIINFKEKPTYTYYSNGGIYLVKKSLLKHIPENSFFNATDLLDILISNGSKVISYPLTGYWLDIGNPEDYKKAQQDIRHISF
jgi:dTDP-glucose pyrophosphorylase